MVGYFTFDMSPGDSALTSIFCSFSLMTLSLITNVVLLQVNGWNPSVLYSQTINKHTMIWMLNPITAKVSMKIFTLKVPYLIRIQVVQFSHCLIQWLFTILWIIKCNFVYKSLHLWPSQVCKARKSWNKIVSIVVVSLSNHLT